MGRGQSAEYSYVESSHPDIVAYQIDIDHEYPTPDNTYWADMIEAIKLKAPDMIISLAMPGKPKTHPVASDPKTQVMSGYTKDLMTKIAPHVDFYNLMT